MIYRLRRHPFKVRALLERTLVLTYALPESVLKPLLPAGLMLDAWRGLGFLAIAMVQTRALRPEWLPEIFAQDFFLAGFRIFTRFRLRNGRMLRGLRILRSYTDSNIMAFFGNLLTHYNYRTADIHTLESASDWTVSLHTNEGDVEVSADLSPGPLPETSPFCSRAMARRFAGPLPFTFDYEKETHSMIRIEGVRQNWSPQQVKVQIARNTWFDQPIFDGHKPVLASAFLIQNVPYAWKRGVREVMQ